MHINYIRADCDRVTCACVRYQRKMNVHVCNVLYIGRERHQRGDKHVITTLDNV